MNEVRIYPFIVNEWFWAYYWKTKEKQWINTIVEIWKKEDIEQIRNWTYTAIEQILEKKYFLDEETQDVWRVHFEITRLTDILKNNQ